MNMAEYQNGRKAITFSINAELMDKYSKACEEKGIIMSRRVERFLEEDLEKIKKHV